jgi:hypothetical protein
VMAIPNTSMTSRHDMLMKEIGDPLALVDKIINGTAGRVRVGICVYMTPNRTLTRFMITSADPWHGGSTNPRYGQTRELLHLRLYDSHRRTCTLTRFMITSDLSHGGFTDPRSGQPREPLHLHLYGH